jgi:hypothetical protein
MHAAMFSARYGRLRSFAPGAHQTFGVGHMAKLALASALTAALLRGFDSHWFFGRYGDAAMLMTRDMLRWFGL